MAVEKKVSGFRFQVSGFRKKIVEEYRLSTRSPTGAVLVFLET